MENRWTSQGWHTFTELSQDHIDNVKGDVPVDGVARVQPDAVEAQRDEAADDGRQREPPRQQQPNVCAGRFVKQRGQLVLPERQELTHLAAHVGHDQQGDRGKQGVICNQSFYWEGFISGWSSDHGARQGNITSIAASMLIGVRVRFRSWTHLVLSSLCLKHTSAARTAMLVRVELR